MSETDINQLQLLQQNLQQVALQKQQFQKQLVELNSAMEELDNTNQAYKIIGGLMISTPREKLKKELIEKKEVLDLKFKNFEKQEQMLQEKTEEIQKIFLQGVKDKNERI